MKASDVPKALALTNQYTSQFKIGQVFQSEEEFSHWFLCPSIPDYVTAYVVEDPVSGDITDMFSFRVAIDMVGLVPGIQAYHANVIALVITKSPAIQLIADLLLYAKQQNVITVLLPQCGLHQQLFTYFLKPSQFIGQRQCIFYNYKYPEVDDDNHCLFGHVTVTHRHLTYLIIH